MWGTTARDHTAWGGPVIDEFYATTLLVRNLDEAGAGWLLLAARETWHLKLARLRDQYVANCAGDGPLAVTASAICVPRRRNNRARGRIGDRVKEQLRSALLKNGAVL